MAKILLTIKEICNQILLTMKKICNLVPRTVVKNVKRCAGFEVEKFANVPVFSQQHHYDVIITL